MTYHYFFSNSQACTYHLFASQHEGTSMDACRKSCLFELIYVET